MYVCVLCVHVHCTQLCPLYTHCECSGERYWNVWYNPQEFICEGERREKGTESHSLPCWLVLLSWVVLSSLVYRSFYMFAIKMCVPMLRCTRNWSWLATMPILPVFLGCLVLSCLTFVSHVMHNCCIDVCVMLCAVLKGCLWMIM